MPQKRQAYAELFRSLGCKIDTVILNYSPSVGVDDQLAFEASSKGDPILKLFRPSLPGRGLPLALRCLELSEVDLRWSSSDVTPALNLHALQELRIRDCARTDLVVSALPRSRALPQLQTLHTSMWTGQIRTQSSELSMGT